jgi:hypothetical protein
MAQGKYADSIAEVGAARVGLSQVVTSPGDSAALPKGVCKVRATADVQCRQNDGLAGTAATAVDEVFKEETVEYTYITHDGNVLNFAGAATVYLTPMQ